MIVGNKSVQNTGMGTTALLSYTYHMSIIRLQYREKCEHTVSRKSETTCKVRSMASVAE